MKFAHRDSALIYSTKNVHVGEYLFELVEDKPGILAALSNVFADHGINILSSTIDRDNMFIHFIVDLSGLDIKPQELIEIFKKFSFIKDIHYRVVKNSIAISSMIIPVFRGKVVIPLSRDLVNELDDNSIKVLENIMYIIGRGDGESVKSIVGTVNIKNIEEIMRITQLRGLGILKHAEFKNDNIRVEICGLSNREKDVKVVKSYLIGHLESLVDSVEVLGIEGLNDCVVITLRLLK